MAQLVDAAPIRVAAMIPELDPDHGFQSAENGKEPANRGSCYCSSLQLIFVQSSHLRRRKVLPLRLSKIAIARVNPPQAVHLCCCCWAGVGCCSSPMVKPSLIAKSPIEKQATPISTRVRASSKDSN
jgi:hypothetical protein